MKLRLKRKIRRIAYTVSNLALIAFLLLPALFIVCAQNIIRSMMKKKE
jgi:hypothetical protein